MTDEQREEWAEAAVAAICGNWSLDLNHAEERLLVLDVLIALEAAGALCGPDDVTRVRELETALMWYGKHNHDCARIRALVSGRVADPCDCGLQAALGGRAGAVPAGESEQDEWAVTKAGSLVEDAPSQWPEGKVRRERGKRTEGSSDVG